MSNFRCVPLIPLQKKSAFFCPNGGYLAKKKLYPPRNFLNFPEGQYRWAYISVGGLYQAAKANLLGGLKFRCFTFADVNFCGVI